MLPKALSAFRLLLTCWLALLINALVLPVCADEAMSKYFDQLRRRRFFSLAEGYGLDRLAQESVSASRRAELTLELSRTFAEHAKYTSGGEQDDLWQRATHVIDQLLIDQPQNPMRRSLEVQRVFVRAAQGEFLRLQSELFPHDSQLRGKAKSILDEAIRQLKSLDTRLDESRRTASSRRRRADKAAAADESRRLLTNVRYQLAAALVNRAKMYPEGSADRIGTLADAEALLRTLSVGAPGMESTFKSQLLLAETSRLRRDFKRAASQLIAITKGHPPQGTRDRIMVERVQLLLATGHATETAEELIGYRRRRNALPVELSFLKVKVTTALWDIASKRSDTALADQLLEQIKAHAKHAERQVGGYWGYRSRQLAEFVHESHRYGHELASLSRKAKSLFHNGNYEESIIAYGEAAVLANQTGQPDLAMDLGYTRASLLLKRDEFDEASRAFQELANRFPTHQRAAGAHLLSAYCLGKLYEQRRTQPRRQAYTDALISHRERYLNDPTTVDATWMLARLEERRLQSSRALKLYLLIPANHQRGPAAQVSVARCYEAILERLRDLRQPVDEWESAAIRTLSGYETQLSSDRDRLSIEHAELLLRFARIRLHATQPDYAEVDRLLQRLFAGRPMPAEGGNADDEAGVPDDWEPLLKTAQQLRIVSLAGQQRFRQAQAMLQTLSQTRPAELLRILDGLTQLSGQFDDDIWQGLGDLQLNAAEQLNRRRAELNSDQQLRLDHCLAQAYAATSRTDRAIEIYLKLLEQSPSDEKLLVTVSELLVMSKRPEFLVKAKQNWRKLESRYKPGSEQWLNARYHVAWCCHQLNEHSECRKLLTVTRLLYPTLGGDVLRSKFRKLQDAQPEARES